METVSPSISLNTESSTEAECLNATKFTLGSKFCRNDTSAKSFDNWIVGNRYIMKRFLGMGSYGNVYEAFDKNLKERVAVKQMHINVNDPKELKQIFREIHILRCIKNPYIIQMIDIIIPQYDFLTPVQEEDLSEIKLRQIRSRIINSQNIFKSSTNYINQIYEKHTI
jgi:serine/threonine protein kinase